ncbi:MULTISPECIES: uridine kinase [unclassified Legionella]|uniref:uridine kinase n=1 Tax=unclassified Legionella TaxID=2622702 RepID=UPI0013EF8803|nr:MULTISPECIES: uridine kinase [unclassified Legionella]MDI9819108.1 uridine kinase [Legionella sp. PL877]
MSKQAIIIGISGPSASGKSLLANTIVNELGSEQVVVISEDAYYKDNSHLPFAERENINYDHPDAFDHALLYEHLRSLQQGKSINIPVYSHSKHIRLPETRQVGQHAIIVLEGILLLSDKRLREVMDIRIFMSTPLDICLTRRLKRDVVERHRSFESVIHQYETTVRPMYLQFIEPSSRYADIIVPRGGENRIAIDMIQAKMRELLAVHPNSLTTEKTRGE